MNNAVSNCITSQLNYDYAQGAAQLHVALNFDANFFLPAGTAITSVFVSNPELVVMVHVFIDKASAEDLAKLEHLAKQYQRCIRVYFLEMTQFADFHIHHHHYSRVAFARLYMPVVLAPLTARYLYLDADTVVIDSLAPLLEFDMQGKTVAGAPISDVPHHMQDFLDFWKSKHGFAINAGIMWIDTKRWLALGFTQKAFAFRGRPAREFIGHDQDIINRVCDGEMVRLPRCFNDEAGKEFLAHRKSVILHFDGRIKPWKVALVISPLVEKWRYFAKLSPWEASDEALPPKEPRNYYYFKYAAGFYAKRLSLLKALRCYATYVSLKAKLDKK